MLWIILIIVVLLILFIISVYNSLVTLRQRVKNAFGQMDVQLQRRFDLIPNLFYEQNKSIDEYVIAGEGEEKEDYLTKKNNVINVRYDAEKSALNKEMIFGKLNKQSFSVREFIRLQGGDINKIGRAHV